MLVSEVVSVLLEFSSGQGLDVLIWLLLDMLARPGVDVVVAYVPMLVSEVVKELERTSDVVSTVETGTEKEVDEEGSALGLCVEPIEVEIIVFEA